MMQLVVGNSLDTDSGRILSFAVFSHNKKLAEKIIDNVNRFDSHDFVCGVANGMIDIKAGLAKIDPEVCQELEEMCKKFPTWYACDECREDEK